VLGLHNAAAVRRRFAGTDRELQGSIEGGLPPTVRPVTEHLDAVPQVLEREGLDQMLELLATASVQVIDAYVDREARKGKLPFDHAPVVVDIEL